MKSKTAAAVLKIILGLYILFCLIIAYLNFAVAPSADGKTSAIIAEIWHFYENEFKTAMIITASLLSLFILRTEKKSVMRRQNITGFIISALIIHVTGPFITGTKELYFFAMPLPWSSFPIQVFDGSRAFHANFTAHWGAAGLGAILGFIIIYNLFIIIGTLLFGRRLQCSQICMFNGFIAEVFSDAAPILRKGKKKAGPKLKLLFLGLRTLLMLSALFFLAAAILSAAGFTFKGNALLYTIETYKYLSVELLMAMFFWVMFTGRGYCYYCPAGTFLAFLSKFAGQKIKTDLSSCIACGKCTKACPMSIDVRKYAEQGKDLFHMDCVGCGHCVDSCPTGTLQYSTRFLEFIREAGAREKQPSEG